MHIVLKSTSDFVKVVMKTSRSPLQCQLNDSINWINPFLDLVGKKCGHLTLMMMKSKKWSCIVLHNFIGDWTTIYGQEKLHQCYWVHNIQNPLFLLFLTSGIHHPGAKIITIGGTRKQKHFKINSCNVNFSYMYVMLVLLAWLNSSGFYKAL